MAQINKQAKKILATEIESLSKQNPVSSLQCEIVAKRLDKLASQSGEPLSLPEISANITDMLPDFNPQVLEKAAQVNQPTSKSKKVVWGVGIGLGLIFVAMGLIKLVNLPYPMVRRPVSRIAPLLLIPSYMEMDHNYRDAIANVQQANQLVNSATSFDDIKLGERKVKAAQSNLDKLPVWFLGYEPQRYCTLFGCSWNFTVDEFQQARTQVGRMEAIVFQQKNAMEQYQQAEIDLQAAREQYDQAIASSEKQIALQMWQHALDTIQQLPPTTLAYNLASAKLPAYQRDFQQVAGQISSLGQTNTMIQVAKQFAIKAVDQCQNPPHQVLQWQQCEELWSEAINRLRTIKENQSGYLEAQSLLAEYQTNLGNVKIRYNSEAESVQIFNQAQSEIYKFQSNFAATATAEDKSAMIAQLQTIIDRLKKVQAGTTVYEESQELLRFAQKKLTELRN